MGETVKPFDLRTHIRDAKTGRVVKVQPYRRFTSRDGDIYERDGVKYYENGELVKKPEKQAPVVEEKNTKQVK